MSINTRQMKKEYGTPAFMRQRNWRTAGLNKLSSSRISPNDILKYQKDERYVKPVKEAMPQVSVLDKMIFHTINGKSFIFQAFPWMGECSFKEIIEPIHHYHYSTDDDDIPAFLRE